MLPSHVTTAVVQSMLPQMLGLESRVALPNGVAALSCAASSQLLLSGWSDGVIHCHSRQPAGGHQQHQQQQRGGAALWTIPNAHIRTHATGVTALQLSNRCAVCSAVTSVL